MMKYIVSCCLLFAGINVHAQPKWTLRQCIDYAIENNIEIQQQELEVKSAEVDVSTSKNSRLPDLNAGINQNFSFGRSIFTGTNTAASADIGTTRFSASSRVPLFTGFRIPNQIKVDKLNLMAATENLNKVKENKEIQVTSLYLEVLFKKELLKVYQEETELTKMQVEKTKILVESGKVPLSQLYDIQAQKAKDELNVTNALNDLTFSLLNLSQALNIKDAENFDIVEPDMTNVIEKNISSIMPVEQIYQTAIAIKPHVKESEYRLQSSKRNLKVAESGYWPSLDFSMSYGTTYDHVYNSEVNNKSFSKQWSDNQSKTIGFSLSIPVFNRFQTRNRVRTARLNIQNHQLILENTKLALYKEIQQAYQSAVSAQVKYTSTERAHEAAMESFKYAEERYSVGKSTVFEFNEVKTKLLSSKSEQVQAKYDFLFRAKILDFYRGEEINIE